MGTLAIEATKTNPDAFLELYDFDSSSLETAEGVAGETYHFTNTPLVKSLAPIYWRGQPYYPLPLKLTSIENKGDGTAPSQPQLALGNTNEFFLAAILSLGDLIGVEITRWRTFYKFTDRGEDPNTLMHYPTQTWIITKKVLQTNNNLQFQLSSPLDMPGVRLPRKQILRDKGFPGVSRVRAR